jgi:hypothetical protein
MSKIRCKFCNDIIESLHRHDFKWCKCKKVFIDGGNDYLRCGTPNGVAFEDAIEIIESIKKD